MPPKFPPRFLVKLTDAAGTITGFVVVETVGAVIRPGGAGPESTLFKDLRATFKATLPKYEAVEFNDIPSGGDTVTMGHS